MRFAFEGALLSRSGTRVVEIEKTSFSGEGEREAGIMKAKIVDWASWF